MNDELKKGLSDLLTKLNQGIDAGADFALEQAPLVVQEWVVYSRIASTSAAVGLFLLASVVLWTLKYRLWRWSECLEEPERDMARFFGFPGGLLLSAFCGGWGIYFTSQALLAWFAPRVLIIKTLADLVK